MSERKFFRQAEWESWFPPGAENQMDLESDSVQLIELSECRFWPFGRPGATGVSPLRWAMKSPHQTQAENRSRNRLDSSWGHCRDGDWV